MAISTEDVVKIATLARLNLPENNIPEIANQLSSILGHMEVLQQVDTSGVDATTAVSLERMPLREDVSFVSGEGKMAQTVAADPAVTTREGFILVPRLSTHEAS